MLLLQYQEFLSTLRSEVPKFVRARASSQEDHPQQQQQQQHYLAPPPAARTAALTAGEGGYGIERQDMYAGPASPGGHSTAADNTGQRSSSGPGTSRGSAQLR
jgi:hypothetical protein